MILTSCIFLFNRLRRSGSRHGDYGVLGGKRQVGSSRKACKTATLHPGLNPGLSWLWTANKLGHFSRYKSFPIQGKIDAISPNQQVHLNTTENSTFVCCSFTSISCLE